MAYVFFAWLRLIYTINKISLSRIIMNKNKIEYQLSNLSNDISHSDYKYIVGSLDALSNVFDFINNKTLVNHKEVLTFITDEMTKRGAFNLKINISNNNK